MRATVPAPAPARPGRAARAVAWFCWLYMIALAAIAMLLWTQSDVWWPVTAFMYAPRWPLGVPLALLVPAAILWNRRSLRILTVGVVLLIWPIMGLCLPWRSWVGEEPSGSHVRVLTCNIHYKQLDAPALHGVIREARPDVVALQYWTSHFEKELFDPGDWPYTHREGQFFLASRFPIRSTATIGDPVYAVRYEIETSWGRFQFANVHLVTPRDGLLAIVHKQDDGVPELEANTRLRRSHSAALTAWLSEKPEPLLIAGDFNTPIESEIYRDYWSGYTNAFSTAGTGFGPTQFSGRKTAVRIDHLLAGPGWTCRECWVGPNVGSEHRPVFADWVKVKNE